MKSISSVALVVAALFFSASIAVDDNLPSQGCFSSTTGLTLVNSTYIYTSKGSCSQQCIGDSKTVFGLTNSTYCYCGTELPPADSKVDNSSCASPCPGYPQNICGGGSTYTSVYLTNDDLEGTVTNVNADGSTSTASSGSSASKTSSVPQSVVTIGGQTVTITPSSSASSSASHGASKAGIAAGVVVGLIAIAAIAGGIYLFIRNKKRREVEEEYRRQAAISAFTNAGKAPGSSGGVSAFSDMRLDPGVMAQRRMSDGSIADNQDYSRRILKVTNA